LAFFWFFGICQIGIGFFWFFLVFCGFWFPEYYKFGLSFFGFLEYFWNFFWFFRDWLFSVFWHSKSETLALALVFLQLTLSAII
jgi:hypothetical protein